MCFKILQHFKFLHDSDVLLQNWVWTQWGSIYSFLKNRRQSLLKLHPLFSSVRNIHNVLELFQSPPWYRTDIHWESIKNLIRTKQWEYLFPFLILGAMEESEQITAFTGGYCFEVTNFSLERLGSAATATILCSWLGQLMRRWSDLLQ